MAKTTWKPAALLAPVPPALVTCGTLESPNVLTVAWTGILSTRPPKTYISLRPERYSYGIIRERGEFAINLTTAALVRAADFCGVRSGRDTDKFAAAGLTPEPSSLPGGCPVLAQSPVSVLCRVCEVLPMGSHDVFTADIAGVMVEDRFLDAAGKLRLEQCGLAAYCHGSYYALGKKLGTMGFSVKKARRKYPDKKTRR